MKNIAILYTMVGLLLCLTSCSSDELPKNPGQRTIFVQATFESPALTAIKKAITPIINGVIKEELQLPQDYNFEFFIPKSRDPQVLTLYYIDNMQDDGDKSIINALNTVEKPKQFKAVHLTNNAEFFGDNGDELVMLIGDTKQELSLTRETIKKALHKEHTSYTSTSKNELYNINKSERFPFAPHTGLGRIRTNSIKQHIKDPSAIEPTFNRIKKRIKEATLSVIQKTLSDGNKTPIFKGIFVFDFDKRASIKEYSFAS